MAVLDLTTFTEVDPGSKISVTASTLTLSAIARNASSYVYKDYSAGGIDGFTLKWKYVVSSFVGTYFGGVGFSNFLGEGHSSSHTEAAFCTWDGSKDFWLDPDNAWGTTTVYTASPSTVYCRLTRTAGSATIQLDLFSDSGYTSNLATRTLTVPASEKYRYLYSLNTYNDGATTHTFTGTLSDFDLVLTTPNQTVTVTGGSATAAGDATLALLASATVDVTGGTASAEGGAASLVSDAEVVTIGGGAATANGGAVFLLEPVSRRIAAVLPTNADGSDNTSITGGSVAVYAAALSGSELEERIAATSLTNLTGTAVWYALLDSGSVADEVMYLYTATDGVTTYHASEVRAVTSVDTAAIDAALTASHGAGSWGAGGGTGSVEYTYHLARTDNDDPIPNATITFTSDEDGTALVAQGVTDTFGNVTFDLDPGTYYVWRRCVGYRFTDPDTEVVT